MKMISRSFSLLYILLVLNLIQVKAQIASGSDYLVVNPDADRSLFFNVSDTGVSKPIIWGLDLAWLSEENIKRGIAFMGKENVDVIRSSFQPTLPLVDGDLQQEQINVLNTRLNLIDLTGSNTKVMLNSDHPSVDSWYAGNAVNWAQLMDATTRRVQEHGRAVVSIAPFNEPDNSATGQGTLVDFYNICGELRNNPRFDSIRICGGNTLNTDQALPWYNQLKDRLDEGNTHQLAGSFDNYARFYQTVKSNGHHRTNDELHNVMEAMVGVEYGMQTGIWWGTAELARGEFVKASDGKRLAYAEHRDNWTAASVYRNPDGKVQAFGGTSERQAVTTTYLFVSKDRDVYFDGYGPQREYLMTLPGGTGYQQGQTNAERVVTITWGDDIQPVINGKYILVNRNSGKIVTVAGGSYNAGANVTQSTNIGALYQQWNVTPVSSTVGGDFSYFTFSAVHSGKALDVLNFSLNNGTNIIVWDNVKSGNQQWYLDYADDGWFYIRSRHSSKCLQVANSSTSEGAYINQWEKTGGENQQWRFLPVAAPVEFDTPNPPDGVIAVSNHVSVKLQWSANTESDIECYTIFRSETAGGPYNTLARKVKGNAFVDHTVSPETTYYYTLKAVDSSLNSSVYSSEVSATASGEHGLVAHFPFEGNISDTSVNANHGAALNQPTFVDGKAGSRALSLNGSDKFIQLPATIANHNEISVALWVFWNGGTLWQRIFEFSDGPSNSISLAPRTRLSIIENSTEKKIDAPALPIGEWAHVVVTLGADKAGLYVNGVLVNEADNITLNPVDLKPMFNYIGRSKLTVPYFNGNIDDFRIYNYVLTVDEILQMIDYSALQDKGPVIDVNTSFTIWPVPASEFIKIKSLKESVTGLTTITVYNTSGLVMLKQELLVEKEATLNIQSLPSGVYFLNIIGNKGAYMKKFIVNQK